MIRIAYKRKIVTDMGGISYTHWTRQYNEVIEKEKMKKLKKISKSN